MSQLVEHEHEHPRTIMPAATRAALDAHVETYLADAYPLGLRAPGGGMTVTLRDAVEHGWYGATAEIAEALDAIVAEARAEVAKRMPYPILTKLDALTDELKRSVGA